MDLPPPLPHRRAHPPPRLLSHRGSASIHYLPATVGYPSRGLRILGRSHCPGKKGRSNNGPHLLGHPSRHPALGGAFPPPPGQTQLPDRPPRNDHPTTKMHPERAAIPPGQAELRSSRSSPRSDVHALPLRQGLQRPGCAPPRGHLR